MVRITNSEQIALAMKARLQRLKKSPKPERARPTDKVETSRSDQTNSLEAIVSRQDDGDDDQMVQKIVTQILADEFGSDMIDDPRFKTVVDRVATLLTEDSDGRDLLDAALSQLRLG
ncbi:MAG: hypothetical protein AAF926_00085 [Pseudomonadota bacterium]